MTTAPELSVYNKAYERVNKMGVIPESYIAALKNGATAYTIFTAVRTPTNGPGLDSARTGQRFYTAHLFFSSVSSG